MEQNTSLIFTLQGIIVSKKNANVWNSFTKIVGKSKRFQDWHKQAVKQIQTQLHKIEPGKCVVHCDKLMIEIFVADNRRCDGDNMLTSVCDLLQDCKILADDCWTVVPSMSVTVKKGDSYDTTIVINNPQYGETL